MPQTMLVAFFFAFQIFGGHLGMALILVTVALSKKVQKHPLLLNFLASWMLYSTSFCLLLYTGHQFDAEKPLTLCIVQLSMVYGSAISTPLSGLALIFNIWLGAGHLVHLVSTSDLEAGIDERPMTETPRWITSVLLIGPYIAFVIIMMYFLLEVGRNPSLVDRTQGLLYCSLNSNQEHAVPYMSGMTILACFVLEALVIVKLIKFRKASKWPKSKLTEDAVFRLFIRIGVFTAYGILSLMTAIQFWFQTDNELGFPHVIQALLPTAAFLIFGTQKDLLRAWRIIPLWNRLFGKKSSASPPVRNEIFHISLARTGSLTDQALQKRLPELPKPIGASTTRAGRRLPSLVVPPRTFIPSFISISEARV